MVMVIAIFAINVYLHRPVVESFLFALALAVGLPAAFARNHKRKPLSWREADGGGQGHSKTACGNREFRQHGCALLG